MSLLVCSKESCFSSVIRCGSGYLLKKQTQEFPRGTYIQLGKAPLLLSSPLTETDVIFSRSTPTVCHHAADWVAVVPYKSPPVKKKKKNRLQVSRPNIFESD